MSLLGKRPHKLMLDPSSSLLLLLLLLSPSRPAVLLVNLKKKKSSLQVHALSDARSAVEGIG